MRATARFLPVLAVVLACGCWFQTYQPQPAPRVAAPNPAPQPFVSPTSYEVHLVNASGVELCALYLSVAGQPWGDNWLFSGATLPPGAEVLLDMDGTVPAWDLRVDDCTGQVVYDGRGLSLPADGLWQIGPPGVVGKPEGYGYVSTGGGTYVQSSGGYGTESSGGYEAESGGGYVAASSGPSVNVRNAAVAAWFLGASASDLDDLVRGDCGFIDSSDLQDFCRGDCGFIDNSDVQDLCRGDCGFIDDSDLQDFCRGDCGFIDNSDLQDFCRGDCGFIDDSDMADACRAL